MRAIPSIDFVRISKTRTGLAKSQSEPTASHKSVQNFATMLQKVYQNLTGVVNGRIGYGDGTHADNIDGVWQTVVFALANTDVTITHNLNRIPVGYHVVSKTAACDIYSGSILWTKTQITLRSTVAGVTVKLFIF